MTRVQKPAKPKPGPRAKMIAERELKESDIRPIQQREISWSHTQQVHILKFLYHHRIPEGNDNYRKPTQQEASDLFLVPQSTISRWVHRQETIEKEGNGSKVRSGREAEIMRWPELESQLYKLFLERREKGQAIRRSWFRVQALFLFRELYPNTVTREGCEIFRFSNGWFGGFLTRYRISIRAITKKAQKVPAEYQNMVLSWLRFNRRNSQPSTSNFWDIAIPHIIGRFDLSNICTLDETPIPFEYLQGRTYDAIGSKTVWAKSTRGGWDKRQASLVLCVFADGIPRIPPMVIFHGAGKRLGDEFSHYHPGVLVEFNEKAYMNEELFLRYLTNYLIPALGGRPSLFALDLMGSHKTPAVLDLLRRHQVIPSLIPAGCTSLLQPLDVSINKPFKEIIRDITDLAILDCEEANQIEQWSTRQCRVLTTSCVGDAFYQFHTEKQQIIIQSFRKVGLALPIDGSLDHELDIKGFRGLQIGYWRREDSTADPFADIPVGADTTEEIEFRAPGEEEEDAPL